MSAPSERPEVILAVDGVDLWLSGRRILDGVSFSVRAGEFTGLIGSPMIEPTSKAPAAGAGRDAPRAEPESASAPASATTSGRARGAWIVMPFSGE